MALSAPHQGRLSAAIQGITTWMSEGGRVCMLSTTMLSSYARREPGAKRQWYWPQPRRTARLSFSVMATSQGQ